VIIGGIIPEDDAELLQQRGIAAIYTPKNVDMNAIMADMLNIIRCCNGLEAFEQVS
jgi:(2R)-ethylmalonyl-CoA mutase